jgi:uncharacterized protein
MTPCPVVHFEMPYRDAARAARFYEQAFGWKPQQLGVEMGHYLLVTTATADARPGAPAGAIGGGLFPYDPSAPDLATSVVIGVDDIAVAMDRVRAAGGEVLGAPMRIPGVGDYVALRDTEGNRVGMLQPLPKDQAAF